VKTIRIPVKLHRGLCAIKVREDDPVHDVIKFLLNYYLADSESNKKLNPEDIV